MIIKTIIYSKWGHCPSKSTIWRKLKTQTGRKLHSTGGGKGPCPWRDLSGSSVGVCGPGFPAWGSLSSLGFKCLALFPGDLLCHLCPQPAGQLPGCGSAPSPQPQPTTPRPPHPRSPCSLVCIPLAQPLDPASDPRFRLCTFLLPDGFLIFPPLAV